MSDFKEITARFNVYDFLNPIVSGSYFIFGIYVIFPTLLDQFKLKETDKNLYIIFIVLFFLVVAYVAGLVLQFLGRRYFSNQANQMIELSLEKQNFSKWFYKYPFDSSLKLKTFIKDAQDIFTKKNLGQFDKNNPEHNNYFYSFCEYHNQIYGFSQKIETLREVWGLSKEMTTASCVLLLLAIINWACIWRGLNFFLENPSEEEIKAWCFPFIFAALTYIFGSRTKLALRNRIRMNYSIFHVSKDLYTMSLKVDNLHKLKTGLNSSDFWNELEP